MNIVHSAQLKQYTLFSSFQLFSFYFNYFCFYPPQTRIKSGIKQTQKKDWAYDIPQKKVCRMNHIIGKRNSGNPPPAFQGFGSGLVFGDADSDPVVDGFEPSLCWPPIAP